MRGKIAGTKRLIDPQHGELTFYYESFTVTGAELQQLVIYHADPGTPAAEWLTTRETVASTAES